MTSVAVLVLIALLAVAIVLITLPPNYLARVLAAVVGVIALVLIVVGLL
jgi:hypothetical protein